jgi:hypothetical protein
VLRSLTCTCAYPGPGSSGGSKVDLELLDTPFMSKPAAQHALMVLQLNKSWPAFLAGITQALMEDVTMM